MLFLNCAQLFGCEPFSLSGRPSGKDWRLSFKLDRPARNFPKPLQRSRFCCMCLADQQIVKAVCFAIRGSVRQGRIESNEQYTSTQSLDSFLSVLHYAYKFGFFPALEVAVEKYLRARSPGFTATLCAALHKE